ncbi:sugar nucleotide-binding protein [Ligilactobacillus ceti]|uniref:Uncharacterized protein n=1 Tax=Ligilactobacillus ceti DSM 22408 TaxID=1122146 RepID=A0A0R2KGA0_9LACO|nr:sugar nucleotide-binding protein [Ligilactobacillus ceti]KRN88382.1 hypothetical protein IV53_GL000346 [Ligilactobacillus ceti DSM 22408]
MIIGNGMMAHAFYDTPHEDLVIFASGVSNSKETKFTEYQRELDLLQATIKKYPEKKLLYFSTASIYDQTKSTSAYVQFKLKVEQLIQTTCQHYLVFRVGNVFAHTGNPANMLNYFKASLQTQQKINLQKKTQRVMIDIDDLVLFVMQQANLQDNQVLDCYYPYKYEVGQIYLALSAALQKEPQYQLSNQTAYYPQPIPEYLKGFFIIKDAEVYLNQTIKKYL